MVLYSLAITELRIRMFPSPSRYSSQPFPSTPLAIHRWFGSSNKPSLLALDSRFFLFCSLLFSAHLFLCLFCIFTFFQSPQIFQACIGNVIPSIKLVLYFYPYIFWGANCLYLTLRLTFVYFIPPVSNCLYTSISLIVLMTTEI